MSAFDISNEPDASLPRPADARRDRVEKMHEYAAFGVRYHWLVDPAIRTVEILELGADGRYAHAVSESQGSVDPVPGCEGLVLDVDALWAQLDRLAPEGGETEGRLLRATPSTEPGVTDAIARRRRSPPLRGRAPGR